MVSGWNLWVWLECIGVVIIIITFPYSTLFWQQHPYFFVHFLKCFFVLVYVIFVKYSKRCSKNIRDRSKIEIRE